MVYLVPTVCIPAQLRLATSAQIIGGMGFLPTAVVDPM